LGTEEELKKEIRSKEKIYYPNTRVFNLMTYFAYGFIAFMALSILAHGITKIAFKDWITVGILLGLTLVAIRYFKFLLTRKYFSIRVNSIGIMITHFAKKDWYSWGQIEKVYLKASSENDMHHIFLQLKHDNKLSKLKDRIGSFTRKLPGNHDLAQNEMLHRLLGHKESYHEQHLYKYPDLENYAKEDPPIEYDFLWGREAAQDKNKLATQIKDYENQ